MVSVVVVVVVDDVVGGGGTVVEVVAVKWQRSSQATVPGGSHSSPPSISTIPSPHSESSALNDLFHLSRRARSVPVIVLQVRSILALRRALPLRPPHEGHTALTLVPLLATLILAEVAPQPLIRETLIPSMTTASGSPLRVALMSGGPSTRKRPPRHAGAASATTRNEPRRPVARATASTIDAFIATLPPPHGRRARKPARARSCAHGKSHAATALAVLSAS